MVTWMRKVSTSWNKTCRTPAWFRTSSGNYCHFWKVVKNLISERDRIVNVLELTSDVSLVIIFFVYTVQYHFLLVSLDIWVIIMWIYMYFFRYLLTRWQITFFRKDGFSDNPFSWSKRRWQLCVSWGSAAAGHGLLPSYRSDQGMWKRENLLLLPLCPPASLPLTTVRKMCGLVGTLSMVLQSHLLTENYEARRDGCFIDDWLIDWFRYEGRTIKYIKPSQAGEHSRLYTQKRWLLILSRCCMRAS